MPNRTDAFVNGHYYHIFNRGVNRQSIFYSDEHYRYCLRLIKKYATKYAVTIIAYCLMPNHYHFLIRQDSDTAISKFINALFNAYVQALNKQIGRSGTLFEGRFKHVDVDRDEYLVHLVRYIHLNPVKAGLVVKPEKYLFSNYLEWIEQRNGKLVDRDFIKCYFPDAKDYFNFVSEYQHEQEIIKLEKYMFD